MSLRWKSTASQIQKCSVFNRKGPSMIIGLDSPIITIKALKKMKSQHGNGNHNLKKMNGKMI